MIWGVYIRKIDHRWHFVYLGLFVEQLPFFFRFIVVVYLKSKQKVARFIFKP